MRKDYRKKSNIFSRINYQITASTIRVLDQEGKQVGILDRQKALDLAREKEVDLVEIAPNAVPPVAKLIEYSKYLYQLKKKKQEEKKRNTGSETKEIRLGLFIGNHDLGIKLKKVREFLAEGNKVRLVVRFKGREMTKRDLGFALVNKVLGILSDIAKVDREARLEGRQMITIISRANPKQEVKNETK